MISVPKHSRIQKRFCGGVKLRIARIACARLTAMAVAQDHSTAEVSLKVYMKMQNDVMSASLTFIVLA